jgi:hypothetical protein
MDEHSLKLARKYRSGTGLKEDNLIINLIQKLSHFNRGKLSVVFPEHYKAFTIYFHEQDLTVEQLKERREDKNVTK